MVHHIKIFISRIIHFFPLTLLGVVLGTGSALGLGYFAYRKMDFVVMMIGYGVLFVLLCLVLTVIGVAFRVRRWTWKTPSFVRRLEVGREYRTGFSLPLFKWIPWMRIRWSLEEPKIFRVRSTVVDSFYQEHVVARERGKYHMLYRNIMVEDIFGLTRISFVFKEQLELSVAPDIGKHHALSVLPVWLVGDRWSHPQGLPQGDRVEMRPYGRGDSMKMIHWKVFGRSRELMVRLSENACSVDERCAIYLVAGEGDHASAALIYALLHDASLRNEWIFGADGSPMPTAHREEALEAIIASASHRLRSGDDMDIFVKHIQQLGFSSIVFFVPSVEGRWLEKIKRSIGVWPCQVQLICGVDPMPRLAHSSIFRRIVFKQSSGIENRSYERVQRYFEKASIPITMIDRQGGRVLYS